MTNFIASAKIRDIIAVMVIFFSFAAVFVVCHYPIPTENKDLVNVAFGFVLGGGVSGVIGYYFGASKPEQPEVNKTT